MTFVAVVLAVVSAMLIVPSTSEKTRTPMIKVIAITTKPITAPRTANCPLELLFDKVFRGFIIKHVSVMNYINR